MSTDAPEVKPGQVWADNDKRFTGANTRYLRVESLPNEDGAGRRIAKPTHAVCIHVVSVNGVGWFPDATRNRSTRIRLNRFRPTASGYRLVEDVPATGRGPADE